jgi:hypothetical protein
MTTSHTTYEKQVYECLLDVLYAQWSVLGLPFESRWAHPAEEVIDPEALIWCSLEFLATDPRLVEGVKGRLHLWRRDLARGRFRSWQGRCHFRGIVLGWLQQRTTFGRSLLDPRGLKADEFGYGINSLKSLESLHELLGSMPGNRYGKASVPEVEGPAGLLLRARNLVGTDARHFLLTYLLSRPDGAKLQEIELFSGYSYRMLQSAAVRWNAVSVDRGYCRLIDPKPWRELLRVGGRKFIPTPWVKVFESVVQLLRTCQRLRQVGLSHGSAVFHNQKKATVEMLRELSPPSPTAAALLRVVL